MKPDFNYNEFPSTFSHCFNEKCTRGDKCLRRQVAFRMPKERGGVYAISPVYLEALDGKECPFFLLDEPQRFAKGITNLFDDLPLRKVEIIKSKLIVHWGRSTYYRCKQKKRLVKPSEQAYVKKLFLAQGIKDEPRYDEYQEYYDLGR
ncbi:MAG: DUF6078 family protein [Parabacteroides sp.]|nr:DUF6078 family protein [Parabacteroides sp.]